MEYREIIERIKSGKVHGVIFAVDHGDVWHHREIERFMEHATEHKIPAKLLEESLDEEKLKRAKDYLKKLDTIEKFSEIAKRYNVTDKKVYELTTGEALKIEQKALDLAVKSLEAGDSKRAEILYELSKGIAMFKNPSKRERYLVFARLKRWGALPADSGALKEMMLIALQNRYDYGPIWKSRNLTMLKNVKKVRASGFVPILVTGAKHAEEIRRLAEREGLILEVIRPKSRATPGEKWHDMKEYGRFVMGRK